MKLKAKTKLNLNRSLFLGASITIIFFLIVLPLFYAVYMSFQGGRGAGNPANPDGLDVDYFWKDILTKDKVAFIIENFACVVKEEKKNKKTGKKEMFEKALFPRYHQLKAVEKIIAHTRENGTDCNYLIQHSAGSGKTNTIA